MPGGLVRYGRQGGRGNAAGLPVFRAPPPEQGKAQPIVRPQPAESGRDPAEGMTAATNQTELDSECEPIENVSKFRSVI